MTFTIANTLLAALPRRLLPYLCVLCLSGAMAPPGFAQSDLRRAPCKQVYLMSYFTTAHEALHLAYSCDGYVWRLSMTGAPYFAPR